MKFLIIFRVLGLSTALTLHAGAFVPSIVSLGSKEQIEKWYLLSKNFHVIGCYAQTELGHGELILKLAF